MKLPRFSLFGKRCSGFASGTIWFAYILFLMPFYFLSRILLPDRFFFDEKTLLEYQNVSGGFMVGDSFVSASYLFKVLGFNGSPISNGLYSCISFALVIGLLVSTVRKSKVSEISASQLFVLLYFSFAQCVFLGVLGKDFVVLLLVLLFWILLDRGVMAIVLWSVVAIVYAIYFRFQWIIVVAFFWIFNIALHRTIRLRTILLLCAIVLAVLGVGFEFVLHVPIDHFREAVNAQRLDEGVEDARTMIVNYLPSDGLLAYVNTLGTLLFLAVPVPLLFLLSPYYLISFFAIAILFSSLCKSFKTLPFHNNTMFRGCLALVIAMVVTQCIYEPDYGSYIRHLVPIFNIIFFLVISRNKLVEHR